MVRSLRGRTGGLRTKGQVTVTSWQAERARNKQPYLRKLVVPETTPCAICGHVRSSHSMLVLLYRCRAHDCDCACFEPRCGCGHLLCSHQWGTAPEPWCCYQCACKHFGATQSVAAAMTLPLPPPDGH